MRRILVAMDASFGAVMACHWTAVLASATGASVTVVHVSPPVDADADAPVSPRLGIIPSDAVKPLEQANIEFDISNGEGNGASEVLRVADTVDADLIVVGRKAHAPLSPHALGAFTHHVLHGATVPVAIVPPPVDQAPRSEIRPLAIAAVDGSVASRPVLRCALQLAAGFGLDLEALTLEPSKPESAREGPTGAGDSAETPPIPLHELLSEIDPNSVVKVAAHTEVGLFPDDLVERSSSGELLVMGTRRRSRVGELLHGSASHYCASHAVCPVVLVSVTEVLERAGLS